MVTLAGVGAVFLAVLARALVVGVEAPALAELPITIVPRFDDRVAIDATSEHHGGQSCLVEAAYADAERAGAFPVVITPRLRGLTIDEIVACQFASRLAVDDADELWACGIIVVEIAWFGRVQVTPRAVVYLAVAIGVGNLRTVAKHRALTGAYCHLGTAVAVEVSNGEAR